MDVHHRISVNYVLQFCPFCGGEAKIMRNTFPIPADPDRRRWVKVKCIDCECSTPVFRPLEGETIADCTDKAVKLWNSRAKRAKLKE